MVVQLILPTLFLLISPFSSIAGASLDGVTYSVYVADNEIRWTLGYMNVSSYDPRGVGAVGMIFLFPRNDTYCFWMKNTRLPLVIVWISGEAVTGWAGGVPLDERPMCGYGDKVLELRPDIPKPKRVRLIGEQRPRH
jgi:hypothetical protein